jgi:hypothetical protein
LKPVVAESAFLNDAFVANCYIGIEALRDGLREFRFAPVEILDGVRAVVDAIAATYASRVNLSDQSFRVLVSGTNRTNENARWSVTMLTKHGEKPRLDVRVFAFRHRQEIHPSDDPSLFSQLGVTEHHVVFHSTRYNTSATASALV